MERQQIKYFVEVAKLEHITRAAERLHISQPSVSLAIRRLEDELGVPLFKREGRNIKINAYGRQFLETAVAVLDLLDQGQQKLDALKFAEESHINISAPPWYVFPNLIEQIMAHNPNITISSVDHNYESIVEMFSKRTLDFCITTTSINDPSLNSMDLRKEEMVLLVSKDNPIAGRKSIRLSECSRLPFATTFKGSKQYNLLESFCHEAGFVPNVMLEVHNVRDVIRMIDHSGSIAALVPLPVLEARGREDLPYMYITDVDTTLMLRMYWPKATSEKSTARWIRQMILDYFDEYKQ